MAGGVSTNTRQLHTSKPFSKFVIYAPYWGLAKFSVGWLSCATIIPDVLLYSLVPLPHHASRFTYSSACLPRVDTRDVIFYATANLNLERREVSFKGIAERSVGPAPLATRLLSCLELAHIVQCDGACTGPWMPLCTSPVRKTKAHVPLVKTKRKSPSQQSFSSSAPHLK